MRLLEDFQRLLGVVQARAEESTVEIAARAGLAPIATRRTRISRVDSRELAVAWRHGEDSCDRVSAPVLAAGLFKSRRRCVSCPDPFAVEGRLDVEALARAIASVARRNEILRTTWSEEGDEVWQVIHPELPIDFRLLVSDVQGPDALRSEAQRLADRAIIDHEGGEGFSLANGPLFRVRVLRLEGRATLAGDYAVPRNRGRMGDGNFSGTAAAGI